MKRTNSNRISVPITQAMGDEAKAAMTVIAGIFFFLIGLSPEERKGMVKINVSNKVFVEDALTAAINNLAMLPAHISVEDLKRNLEGFIAIDDLVGMISQLAQKFRDTQVLMGAEAYATALSIYHFFESASNDGVPGAEAVYNQLAARFRKQGNFKKNGGGTGDPAAS